MTRPDERGAAGSVLTAGVCLCVVCAFLAASMLIQWFLLIRQGEQAAELAALAAVSAAVDGDAPCAAALAAAGRNGVEVDTCVVRGAGRRIVVEIGVRVVLEPRLPASPGEVIRSATAGT